jgi:hypothetical protein
MTTQISPLPIQRFYDNNNFPLSGGQLYTYIAGTTTPLPTFTDSTGVTANSNPVVMNARGEANVWMTANQGYKFVLKDASWNTIWTEDNLYAAGAIGADLSNLTDPTKGTALVGFKLNATGSVGRTLSSKLQDTVSVKDFGATGDGITDDTASIQAATTWAGPLGKRIYFPAGSYIYGGVAIAAGMSPNFIGESTSNTFLLLTSGTAIGFNCATNAPVVFENLTFGYKAGITGTAGSFIAIPGATDTNYNSRFRNLQMNAPWVGITTSNAASWVADRVSIGGALSVGIHVQNIAHPDNGDSTISNCSLTTSSTTAIGILQRSSGGLRIINNKMIGGAYYYQLILDTGANTSDLIVVGNSLEGANISGLEFRRNSTSGSFSNITIASNQFAGAPNVINFDDATAGWMSNVSVSNNAITVQGGAGITVNSASNFSITGNAIRGVLTTEVGIQIGSAAISGSIGANNFSNLATGITNNSTTTAVSKRVLNGTTGTIVCSTAVGSVFSGTGTITFPAGYFGSVPRIQLTVNGGSGGFGGSYSGAGTAGASVLGFAATTGSNISLNWTAEADY